MSASSFFTSLSVPRYSAGSLVGQVGEGLAGLGAGVVDRVLALGLVGQLVGRGEVLADQRP